MWKKIKDNWDKIFTIGIFSVVIIILLLRIIVISKYGNLPISEVPAWAIPFFTGG